MIKLAVFDLDGTLVNSLFDLADAANKALSDNGYDTYEYDRYRYFVGNGTKKLIERTLPEGSSAEECERIHAVFSANYREHCIDKTRPYDGIERTLAVLKERGIKCAIASNKPDEFSREIVSALFPEGTFDIVRGKLDGVPTKPAPDIVNTIMQAADCTADETVMIGDSNVDVQTAHNAGIRCIGCIWGFRGEDELTRAGADLIARTPEEIAKLIK